MYLASALGASPVGIFGWTNPEIWRPPDNNATIVSKEIECRPCNRNTRKEICWSGKPSENPLSPWQTSCSSSAKFAPQILRASIFCQYFFYLLPNLIHRYTPEIIFSRIRFFNMLLFGINLYDSAQAFGNFIRTRTLR